MKIVHVISNKVWGGGEQYVYDLCNNLKSDGYEIELLIRPITAIANNVRALGVPTKNYSFVNLLKIKNAIVHVHNFKDALKAVLAKLLAHNNIQIVVTRHLVRPAKTSFLYTKVYDNVKKIIFVSELAKKAFLSSYPTVDAAKLCVVRNSILYREIQENINLRNGQSSDTVILMYHGRIAKEKGLDVLIEAISKLRDISYHLYLLGTGDADYINKLKSKIEDYKITDKVSFLGFKSDIMPYISQTDIGIIPTVAQEACGLSCMEYMMLGKCLITTNNGGQAEYIDNGVTGLLVNPSNPQQLLDAIYKAINERKTIGERAKAFFDKELAYDKFYQRIKQIYEE